MRETAEYCCNKLNECGEFKYDKWILIVRDGRRRDQRAYHDSQTKKHKFKTLQILLPINWIPSCLLHRNRINNSIHERATKIQKRDNISRLPLIFHPITTHN